MNERVKKETVDVSPEFKMATEFQSKPPIPVVGHVISDDSMGLKQVNQCIL